MGAGSSSLPTKLKEEDLQHLISDMFQSFKDSDGYVDKEILIAAAFTGQEKEVIDLFMKFSKSGSMDAKGFHELCLSSKLFNKTNFRATESVRVFQKALVTIETTTGNQTQTINYPTFRKLILPEIAERKSLHIDNLIFKLSRVECNVPRLIRLTNENPQSSEKARDLSVKDRMKSMNDDDFDDIPVVEVTEEVEKGLSFKIGSKYSLSKGELVSGSATPDQHHAATRIQSLSRMRTASRYVNELKQVMFCIFSSSPLTSSPLCSPLRLQINSLENQPVAEATPPPPTSVTVSPDIEPILKEYFQKFAPYSHSDQIDLSHFIKLCHDASLIQRKFTVVDAELAFIRAKKKANLSTLAKYKNGVFFDKRINFIVFREILLRCVIEKTGVSIDMVLHQLINAAKR
jgi:hypothetical protein